MALEIPYPDDLKAPFGYEDDGITPKSPMGLKSDGNPRVSNRGRKAGSSGTTGPRRTTTTRSKKGRDDARRAQMLRDLTDMWITTPLAALSKSDAVAKRIGEKQADALAADAYIIDAHKEGLVTGLIYLSQTKPGVLSWLDTVEEKAPWMMLAMVGVQIAQAIATNHMSPNNDLATRGRNMAQQKAEAYAAMMADTEADQFAA